jgi:hypothetical protein
MTDIVKGMGGEFARVLFSSKYFSTDAERHEAAMRAALLWLADNVSDEMCHNAAHQYFDMPLNEVVPPLILVEFGGVIAAAIRAAAGGEAANE